MKNSRRNFLYSLPLIGGFLGSTNAKASNGLAQQGGDPIGDLNGKHKMVFDTITPFNGYQVVWPFNFLETHNSMGVIDKEINAIIVLRSKAVSMALNDQLWKKYKLGKFYKVTDPIANTDADRNLYWNPTKGEMPEEGTALNELINRGVLVCVCEKALALNSSQVAKSKNLDPLMVKKEWLEGILPGIKPVPSGVWALNKVQEAGASYCYAG